MKLFINAEPFDFGPDAALRLLLSIPLPSKVSVLTPEPNARNTSRLGAADAISAATALAKGRKPTDSSAGRAMAAVADRSMGKRTGYLVDRKRDRRAGWKTAELDEPLRKGTAFGGGDAEPEDVIAGIQHTQYLLSAVGHRHNCFRSLCEDC